MSEPAFRLCAVVPVFNHHQVLGRVLDALSAANLFTFVVDDGSAASSAERIDALLAGAAHRQLVRLPENRGKGAAVLAGMRAALTAGFSHALQVDADGQHDLGDLPKLRAAAEAHPHCLISGRPIYDDTVPAARYIGRYVSHVWVWINTLSLSLRDSMCGFRIYPLTPTVDLADRVRIGQRMDFDTDIMVRLYWAGVPSIFVPTAVTYPLDGISHFDLWRDNLRIARMHTKHFFLMLANLLTGKRFRLKGAAHGC